MTRLAHSCVLLLAVALLVPPAASAAFPGTNGKIVFSRDGRLYTVLPDGSALSEVPQRTAEQQRNFYPTWSPDGTRLAAGGALLREEWDDPGSFHWTDTDLQLFAPDGSGFQRLDTPNQHFSTMPTWSPDGTRIAFVSDKLAQNTVYTARPDGTDVRPLPDATGHGAMDPSWSPDGSRIAFWSMDENGESDLFTIRPDGSDLRRFEMPGAQSEPDWSPDGKWLAFTGGAASEINIYVVPAAGGPATQLTHSGQDSTPAWAPDASAIVFASNRDAAAGTARQDLYVIKPDGSGERRLTTIGCWQCYPDWQPLPARAQPPRHPRAPWSARPHPPVLKGPVHLTKFRLSRHRFSRRALKRVRLTLRLDAPGDVTFRLGHRRTTRHLPAGTSRLKLGRLFPRRLKPGYYRLAATTGTPTSTLRIGLRVLP